MLEKEVQGNIVYGQVFAVFLMVGRIITGTPAMALIKP